MTVAVPTKPGVRRKWSTMTSHPGGEGSAMAQRFRPDQLLGQLNELEAKHAPATLFTAGCPNLLKRHPRVSIVGTRTPTVGGSELAVDVTLAVIEHGGIVVSGLAKGIDTVALTTAIGMGGQVVAVIGTPLDRAYPAENEELQDLIARNHLLVSQFAPGTRTGRHSFPLRNRTMALLSDATIIVEAGETSGTQHQGWEAIRLGRMLLLPSSLIERGVTWAAKMLTYGAQLYDSGSDVRAFLEEQLPVADDLSAAVAAALAPA